MHFLILGKDDDGYEQLDNMDSSESDLLSLDSSAINSGAFHDTTNSKIASKSKSAQLPYSVQMLRRHNTSNMAVFQKWTKRDEETNKVSDKA